MSKNELEMILALTERVARLEASKVMDQIDGNLPEDDNCNPNNWVDRGELLRTQRVLATLVEQYFGGHVTIRRAAIDGADSGDLRLETLQEPGSMTVTLRARRLRASS